MWRRVLLIVVVGVCVGALGVAYLALRSHHAHSKTVSPNVALSVSCPSPGSCTAVDDQGNVLRLTDGVWSGPRSIQDAALNSVSCPTVQFCAAVGVNGTAFFLRGTTWSAAGPVDPQSDGQIAFRTSGLDTVSCASASFCVAGDVLGRVTVFDGSRWKRPHPIEPRDLFRSARRSGEAEISGVSCPRATFCAAVSADGYALTYDGKSWSTPVQLEPARLVGIDRYIGQPALAGVSCPTPTFCATVDPSGNVFTFDGTTWSAPRSVDPQAGTAHATGVTAVSCPTSQTCVAADELGKVVTSAGGSWSGAVPVDPTLGLAALSCPSSTFCVALNDVGAAFTYDGHSWSPRQDIDRSDR
jgi:hypothetical protein